MNGDSWKVRFVSEQSPKLVDRTNRLKLATTDVSTNTIYLSDQLTGDFLMTVFLHELGHCALFSFGLLDEIHQMTYPEYWIDMEEFICNILADYGREIFKIAYPSYGYHAWKWIPKAFERRFA